MTVLVLVDGRESDRVALELVAEADYAAGRQGMRRGEG